MAGSSWTYTMPAMWGKGGDPAAYVPLEVDATALVAALGAADRHGQRLQPTALVLAAVGRALAAEPDVNVTLRWGRVRARRPIDAWVTLTRPDGHLGGKRLEGLDARDAFDIQAELDAAQAAHGDGRGGREPPRWFRLLPRPLLSLFLRVAGFMIHDLRLPVGGLDREGFGCIHVTSVGSQGLRWGFAPIPPITRHPLLLVVGAIHDAAAVVDGKVVVRPVLPVSITADHRMAVGVVANRWRQALQAALEDPDQVAAYTGRLPR